MEWLLHQLFRAIAKAVLFVGPPAALFAFVVWGFFEAETREALCYVGADSFCRPWYEKTVD